MFERLGSIPLTNEFKMDIARLEIPVSGWTCLSTKNFVSFPPKIMEISTPYHTLVNVRGVSLLSSLGPFLFFTTRGSSLLASFLFDYKPMLPKKKKKVKY